MEPETVKILVHAR